ncbi:glutamine amidotransferase-related protein [Blattabacterium cuenoti]|uniref:glutamine amidotransferase-related protein n=1 Tax=Blattabacterium cuenoti TaxID=1653831 RepID=UPI00311E263B
MEKYHKIILSPGPGIPDKAHILKPLVKTFYSTKSILGVCLGQQAKGKIYQTQAVATIASIYNMRYPTLEEGRVGRF